MRIFDHYIRWNIIKTICLVALAILCLDSFFKFISQGKYVARHAGYDYFDVAQFVLLSLPAKIVELLPSITLLGVLLGMGGLVSNNELTAMRTFGYSIYKIAIVSIGSGLIFCLTMLALMQFVIPKSEPMARNFWLTHVGRSVSNSQNNYWTKLESTNKNTFIHIDKMKPQGNVYGVTIIEVKDRQVLAKIEAKSAQYEAQKWVLNDVKKYSFSDNSVEFESYENWVPKEFLPADVYKLAKINPRILSISSLSDYAGYLKKNNLDYYPYYRAFWNKISSALSILVMILIAIPFIFSDKRSGNAGARLLIGIVLGMSYHILSQTISNLGQIYQWSALFSAFAPLLVFALLGIVLLKRI